MREMARYPFSRDSNSRTRYGALTKRAETFGFCASELQSNPVAQRSFRTDIHDHNLCKGEAHSGSMLGEYDWPGNIRELENVIERAVVLSTGEEIQPEDLAVPTLGVFVPTAGVSHYQTRLEGAEKGILLQALKEHRGTNRPLLGSWASPSPRSTRS
jgi:hypothetical protein